MMKPFRMLLIPAIAVSAALLAVWYVHLPAPVVTTSMAQVVQEARDGEYRLIDMASLSGRYATDPEDMLLVDTRQAWEHRAGHIAGSIHFPIEPTWWDQWHKKGALKALLGPDQDKLIVFY